MSVIPSPDVPRTPEQKARVDLLTVEQLAVIDAALLANCRDQWRKIAMIVGLAMGDLADRLARVPDVFYANRVRGLVRAGHLESRGDLAYMGFSEVRVAPARAIDKLE